MTTPTPYPASSIAAGAFFEAAYDGVIAEADSVIEASKKSFEEEGSTDLEREELIDKALTALTDALWHCGLCMGVQLSNKNDVEGVCTASDWRNKLYSHARAVQDGCQNPLVQERLSAASLAIMRSLGDCTAHNLYPTGLPVWSFHEIETILDSSTLLGDREREGRDFWSAPDDHIAGDLARLAANYIDALIQDCYSGMADGSLSRKEYLEILQERGKVPDERHGNHADRMVDWLDVILSGSE